MSMFAFSSCGTHDSGENSTEKSDTLSVDSSSAVVESIEKEKADKKEPVETCKVRKEKENCEKAGGTACVSLVGTWKFNYEGKNYTVVLNEKDANVNVPFYKAKCTVRMHKKIAFVDGLKQSDNCISSAVCRLVSNDEMEFRLGTKLKYVEGKSRWEPCLRTVGENDFYKKKDNGTMKRYYSFDNSGEEYLYADGAVEPKRLEEGVNYMKYNMDFPSNNGEAIFYTTDGFAYIVDTGDIYTLKRCK